MERQRSPRDAFITDIVLNNETEFDQTVNQRVPSERDSSRYVLNMNRSSRNSLLAEDYYRNPGNGGRSPRNSLVPGTGLTSEMVYGSRHSVHDAGLSPRNSLVPDVAYNRSPRNSMAGSRTSLMSENGNPAPRSPRHSIVPNSSRCPRGSITHMELVDRSPQRSPRESIASEYLNQGPRNSLTPYEPVASRTPRGSISVNDTPRTLVGVTEDEVRPPRRSIEPDVIDRTPRGSLGGLPERRLTKPNIIAQDPRRASVDQGVNANRNSSPYREKLGGNAVQTNLGYGLSGFTDSRRASSSVSQFSGDESRRLFNNGVKAPVNKMENGNFSGITYGSVVFQLKDANLEANGSCDFVFRALKVVCKTHIVTDYLVLLSFLPVLMLIFGWKFSRNCPVEERVPIYMIIGGIFGSIFMFLITYSQIRSRRPEILSVQPAGSQISFVKLIIFLLSCFLVVWFAMGNYWILHIMWPPHRAGRYRPNDYCDKTLYVFSVVHLGIIYLTFAIIIFAMVVLASFRILGWWLPER